MHRGEEGSCPLLPVLGPNAQESPQFILTFDLRAQVKRHESLGKFLDDGVNLSPSFPLVVAIVLLAIALIGQQLSRAQEWIIRAHRNRFLKQLEESVVLVLIHRLTLQVIVEGWLDALADQLG